MRLEARLSRLEAKLKPRVVEGVVIYDYRTGKYSSSFGYTLGMTFKGVMICRGDPNGKQAVNIIET